LFLSGLPTKGIFRIKILGFFWKLLSEFFRPITVTVLCSAKYLKMHVPKSSPFASSSRQLQYCNSSSGKNRQNKITQTTELIAVLFCKVLFFPISFFFWLYLHWNHTAYKRRLSLIKY
jgi:hypothetical protein